MGTALASTGSTRDLQIMGRAYNSGLDWWRNRHSFQSDLKELMSSMLRCIICALLITVSSAALSEENCQSEKSIKSADSDKATKVQFKNESKSKVKI